MTAAAEPMALTDISCAIRTATMEVFSIMLGIDVDAREDRTGLTELECCGVVAVLGLTGAWGGSGQFSCDSALALRIASQLLMGEFEKVDEEVLDAVAEVANMIIGNVKTALEQRVGPMGLSTPAVFFGGDFETRVVGNTRMVLVPFACEAGSMTVQVAVAPMARTRLRHRG